MNILDDMGVSKLSAKVFFYSFKVCLHDIFLLHLLPFIERLVNLNLSIQKIQA